MSGSPDGVRFRPASVDDVPAIARISVRGWRAAYPGIIPDAILAGLDVGRREQGWAELMARGDGSRIDVVERAGEILGFVASGPARDGDLPATAGEVFAIYLDPHHLRVGLGTSLLARAEAGLRLDGRTPLVLWVLTGNAAGRRFYEATGWRPDGASRPLDFGGTPVDEMRYRRA